MPAPYWALVWQAIGVATSLIVGAFGLYKIYIEIAKIRYDKDTQKKLEQTKFFLEQHRRLFDDEVLFEILSLIDARDTSELAKEEMIDKKRKFLTFLEEIAILHYQKLVDPEISFYMFGYYAKTTKFCSNFWCNFDTSPLHWGMFYKFVEDYQSSQSTAQNKSKSSKSTTIRNLISIALLIAALFIIYKFF